MSNPLCRKLDLAGGLEADDHAALHAISTPTRQVGDHRDLSREGERPETVSVLMEGLACRYKILPGGRRQIVALLLPGDFCDLHAVVLGVRDHSIGTLAPCRVAEIPRATIDEVTARRPNLARAFQWAALVEASILREWLTGMGQRQAEERIAHLSCELLVRLRIVGQAMEDGYDLPMTQAELAD